MTTSWILVDRQITGENSTNGHPQRIYRRSSPHLQPKSVEKGCADPGSRCHGDGDGTHSNDLPGCVVGGVTDITQPRARPGSGHPSSRSRGYHLGMARAPPPRPAPGPVGARARPGGSPRTPGGPGGGGLTTPATPFSNYASLGEGTSLSTDSKLPDARRWEMGDGP